jgi:hypothetical protein
MARRRGQDMTKNGRLNGSESSTGTLRLSAQDDRSQKAANGKTIAPGHRDRIETLAYQLYLRRGRLDGYDKQDWLEAEQITLSQSPALTDDHAGTPTEIST